MYYRRLNEKNQRIPLFQSCLNTGDIWIGIPNPYVISCFRNYSYICRYDKTKGYYAKTITPG